MTNHPSKRVKNVAGSDSPVQFWIIKHPSSGGDIVAKMDTPDGGQIPQEVVDHNDFVVVQVPDRSGLTNKTINHSNLTDSEKELLSRVYQVDGY